MKALRLLKRIVGMVGMAIGFAVVLVISGGASALGKCIGWAFDERHTDAD